VPGPTPNTTRARGNPQRNAPLPQNAGQDVGATPARFNVVPEINDNEFKGWVNALMEQSKMDDKELATYWDMFSYKGFNRVEVLKQMAVAIPNPKTAAQAVIVVALRGPQQGSKIKLTEGRSLLEMGIPASGGQGTKVLTCNKIQAATADLAAFFLKRLNVPKRMDMPLPGWLQFPSAGGIKMPENYRRDHIEFSRRFSALIGGVFQEQIYMQMQSNAYLDERLRLFD